MSSQIQALEGLSSSTQKSKIYTIQIQIQKNQAGAKFMVKYLNINFPLGSGSSGGGGVRKVEFNPNKR